MADQYGDKGRSGGPRPPQGGGPRGESFGRGNHGGGCHAPLYQEARGLLDGFRRDLPKDGHAGLWYDKFCCTWQTWAEGLTPDGKRDWLQSVTGREIGDRGMLGELTLRQRNLAGARAGAVLHFESTSRFVSGLGREHPMENGFAWHPTLGTPYLPGSSVKGMVRAFAELWGEGDKNDIRRIFGPRAKESDTAEAGSVVFLDALPLGPVRLVAEVMTPHYGPWYMKGETPGDWHSPVPVTYLATEAGFRFQFVLLPRTAGDDKDLELAVGWLREALEWTGAGAKTAIGFGRFREKPAPKVEAPKSPLEAFTAWLDGSGIKPQDKGRHDQVRKYIEEKLGGMAEAKAHVREKFARKNCSPKFWDYLNS